MFFEKIFKKSRCFLFSAPFVPLKYVLWCRRTPFSTNSPFSLSFSDCMLCKMGIFLFLSRKTMSGMYSSSLLLLLLSGKFFWAPKIEGVSKCKFWRTREGVSEWLRCKALRMRAPGVYWSTWPSPKTIATQQIGHYDTPSTIGPRFPSIPLPGIPLNN